LLIIIVNRKDGGHRMDGILLIGPFISIPIYLFSTIFIKWFVTVYDLNSTNIHVYYFWLFFVMLFSVFLLIYRYVIKIQYLQFIFSISPTFLGLILLYVRVLDAWVLGFIDLFGVISSSILFVICIILAKHIIIDEEITFLELLEKFQSEGIGEINLKEISNLPVHRFFTYGNEVKIYNKIQQILPKYDLIFENNNILLVKKSAEPGKLVKHDSLMYRKTKLGDNNRYWSSAIFLLLIGIMTYFLIIPLFLEQQTISIYIQNILIWIITLLIIIPMIQRPDLERFDITTSTDM